jgi:hypothetical protein
MPYGVFLRSLNRFQGGNCMQHSGRYYTTIFVYITICLCTFIALATPMLARAQDSTQPEQLSASTQDPESASLYNAESTSLYNAESTSLYNAAVWPESDETRKWTQAAILEIRKNMARLDQAGDIQDFCPGYHSADQNHREVCWLRIIGAVVKFESGFNANDMFKEANGTYSVGLLALSPHECDAANSLSALKNPVNNLSCGIGIMARLIDGDGKIGGSGDIHGAAAYWSTLRWSGHGSHHHGYRPQIASIASQYKNF